MHKQVILSKAKDLLRFKKIPHFVQDKLVRCDTRKTFKESSEMKSFRLLSRHWIVDEEGRIIIGEGRSEILENIEKTGSINLTAKIMKMSYKGVWSKIKATEETMKVRIVHSNRKQGSMLTKEGKELLRSYKVLKEKCLKADDRIFKSIFE